MSVTVFFKPTTSPEGPSNTKPTRRTSSDQKHLNQMVHELTAQFLSNTDSAEDVHRVLRQETPLNLNLLEREVCPSGLPCTELMTAS